MEGTKFLCRGGLCLYVSTEEAYTIVYVLVCMMIGLLDICKWIMEMRYVG